MVIHSAQLNINMRPIAVEDNLAIAEVIRTVSAEYGLTADKGYGVSDPQLDRLYQVYSQPRAAYWVITLEGSIVGGGGIAPLQGAASSVCELQKMYFLPLLRGKGWAKRLTLQALEFARQQSFERCYLETTACLAEAVHLYQRLGFEHINYTLGETGHNDCEIKMLKIL